MARLTRSEKRDLTTAQLFETARAVFLERGYHRSTLDDIADAVSFGTIVAPETIVEGSGIRERNRLVKQYGKGNWKKKKGIMTAKVFGKATATNDARNCRNGLFGLQAAKRAERLPLAIGMRDRGATFHS